MQVIVSPENSVLSEINNIEIEKLQKLIDVFEDKSFKIGYKSVNGIYPLDKYTDCQNEFFYLLLNFSEGYRGFYDFLDLYLRKIEIRTELYCLNYNDNEEFKESIEYFIKVYYDIDLTSVLTQEQSVYLKKERELLFAKLFTLYNL